MQTITTCNLKPLYLYSGFHFWDLGEQIWDGEFWIFEINGEFTYDFITSLN